MSECIATYIRKGMGNSMILYRDEFNKLVIRLGIIKDQMAESGFTETAQVLAEVITRLNSADQTYISELAHKKQMKKRINSDSLKP